MRLMVVAWPHRCIAWLCLLLGGALTAGAGAEEVAEAPPLPSATNVLQLYRLTAQSGKVNCHLQLEGIVCAVNAAKGLLVLQDDSGAELLQMDPGTPPLSAGQKVRLEAEHCLAEPTAFGVRLRTGPVVDNDGIHSMHRNGGSVFLKAGRHPVRLAWFNALGKYGLAVAYQPPGQPRQPVPCSALFRLEVDLASGHTNLVNGLDYRCYEGDWGSALPEFDELTPVKSGTTSGFDLGVRTRDEHVAVEFTGFLAVPQEGLYTFETDSDDGSELFIDESPVRVETIGFPGVPAPRRLALGQVLRDEEERQWAEVEGRVGFASQRNEQLELELGSGPQRMGLVVVDASGTSAATWLRKRIRVVGVCQTVFSLAGSRIAGELLALSQSEMASLEGAAEPVLAYPVAVASGAPRTNIAEAGKLPLLTSVDEVKRLKREEAQRGYPVKIRGVVTRAGATVIQDSTRGVFVSRPRGLIAGTPRLGEYWEVEGVTGPGDFAPVVDARRMERLGVGRLPEPLPATWDQLMNGSLDTQYVEIQGIVTAVRRNRLELLLREGKLNIAFPEMDPAALSRYENTLVRVRGCLFPAWDRQTHLLKVGEMDIASASINIDEAAPVDVFSTQRKPAAELLLFDLQASAFQRVKVAGQVLGARGGQYFIADGTNGLRFNAKEAQGLQVGDLVEAVGFPELVGPSPVLREAVARRTGHAQLPEPRKLRAEHLLDDANDATRVRLEGVLLSRHRERGEQVLEMQFGLRTALARLPAGDAFVQSLAVGSVLELTGVYAGLGGNRALGRGIDSFELLLDSASDIRVLARPPWWTLPRILTAFGVAAVILLGAMLWVASLRRQVRAQTEIIRQKAQREATLEERTRIAKDIHDDLGSSLTFIMMLGERSREDMGRPVELAGHTDKIVGYARGAVQALDEIVWAVNPQNDTLDGLVGYLNQYASQLFENTNLRCRLEIPETLPAFSLPAEVRHDLFLAVKEALNNVLKHARASEVAVVVAATPGRLEITVADNGRGFDPTKTAAGNGGNGLENMSRRMAKIGGEYGLTSAPGQGTRLRFAIRLEGLPR